MSASEFKYFKYALQNSLIESKKDAFNYSIIPQMPVFRPTATQFKDPIKYIEELFTGENNIA